MCGKLGMTLAPDLPERLEAALGEETSRWAVDHGIVEKLKLEALNRQVNIVATDLEAASNGAKSDTQLRAVKGVLVGYGRTCLSAAADPIFSSLVVTPEGYDLDLAATTLADSMLESGGLASWQTPDIQARGDIMMTAGICRSRIGAARSDALVKQYGQSNDPKVRNYFSKSFDEGLADPTAIGSLAGCNRAIAGFRARVR